MKNKFLKENEALVEKCIDYIVEDILNGEYAIQTSIDRFKEYLFAALSDNYLYMNEFPEDERSEIENSQHFNEDLEFIAYRIQEIVEEDRYIRKHGLAKFYGVTPGVDFPASL